MSLEISKPQKLLDENGKLTSCGWSGEPLLQYDRDNIKVSRLRIQEWESYLLVNDSCALRLTIADYGTMGLVSATLLDFQRDFYHTETVKQRMSLGRMGLPFSSIHGDATYTKKRIGMNFSKAARKRSLKCDLINFVNGKNLYVQLELEEKDRDTLVCALPFSCDPHCFHYSQKTIYSHIQGTVRCGGEEYSFQNNAFGLLDWGRCVWPRSTSWNAACCQGTIEGKSFSFYISDGPSDYNQVSESAYFLDGKLYKIEGIHFSPQQNLSLWTIHSEDRRIMMTFEPAFPYIKELRFGLGRHDSRLIFGIFSGRICTEYKTVSFGPIAGFLENIHHQMW